jgi:ABC-2 type transport system ATP-binding protein
VIRTGELVAIEEIERLRARAGQVVIVEFADGAPEDELSAIPGVQDVQRQTNGAYHLKLAGSIDPVIKVLARHTIRRLEVEEAPLEEVFLKFYTGETSASEPASAKRAGTLESPAAS